MKKLTIKNQDPIMEYDELGDPMLYLSKEEEKQICLTIGLSMVVLTTLTLILL